MDARFGHLYRRKQCSGGDIPGEGGLGDVLGPALQRLDEGGRTHPVGGGQGGRVVLDRGRGYGGVMVRVESD